jgi:hypothetical protein
MKREVKGTATSKRLRNTDIRRNTARMTVYFILCVFCYVWLNTASLSYINAMCILVTLVYNNNNNNKLLQLYIHQYFFLKFLPKNKGASYGPGNTVLTKSAFNFVRL